MYEDIIINYKTKENENKKNKTVCTIGMLVHAFCKPDASAGY